MRLKMFSLKDTGLLLEGITYLFIEALSRGIPLIILPLVATRYTQAEMGLYSELLLFASYASSLINFSCHSYVNIMIGKNYGDTEKQVDLVRKLMQILIILSALMTLILLIIQYVFHPLKSDHSLLYISIICLSGTAQTLFAAAGAYFRAVGKKIRYLVLNVCNITIFCICLLFVTLVFNAGIWAIIAATSLGLAISSIILLTIDPGILKWSGPLSLLCKEILGYSFSVTLNDSMNLTASSTTRITLAAVFGSETLAPYHVALSISQIISVINQTYNMIYVPRFFSAHFAKKSKKAIDPLFYPVVTSLLIAAFMILFSDIYSGLVFSNLYKNIADYLIFPIFSSCLLPLYFVLSNILSVDSKIIRYKTLVNILTAGVSLVLAIILSKIFGINGALFASPLGALFGIVANYYFVRKKTTYKVPIFIYLIYIISCLGLIELFGRLVLLNSGNKWESFYRYGGLIFIISIQYFFSRFRKKLMCRGEAYKVSGESSPC